MPGVTDRSAALLLLLGQYSCVGLLGGFSFYLLPGYLRSQGVDFQSIGLVALVLLPHALKFLWAAWVDRLCQRWRRACLLGCYGSIALAILALALLDPARQLPLALLLLGLSAFFAACGDVASDGLAVLALPATDYPAANRIQIGASYLGFLICGLLLAPLLQHLGWQASAGALLLLLLLCLLPLLCLRLPALPAQTQARPSLRQALRPRLRGALGLVVLVQSGPRLLLAGTSAYWVERGFSLTEVGALEAWCTAMGLIGALLAPPLLQRRGTGSTWAGALLLGMLACLALLIGEYRGNSPQALLLLAFSLSSLGGGIAFVALYSRMMQWADPRQPGSDVTLLQCADAWVAIVAGLLGGWLAEQFGFSTRFAVTAALLLLAVLCLTRALRRVDTSTEQTDSTPQGNPVHP